MARRKAVEKVKQSVVIPSGGDLQRLPWALAGLAAQEGAPSFEVIVIGDISAAQEPKMRELIGRWNDSADLGGTALRFELLPLKPDGEEDNVEWFRTGAARNLGAQLARGEQLICLDEDCIPDADFLAAHWEVKGKLAYGMRRHFPLSRVREYTGTLDIEELRWYCSDDPRTKQGYEYVGSGDWWTCNSSCPTAAWLAIGGVDLAFDGGWGGMDIDVGCRLERHGLETVRLECHVTHLDHPRREERRDHLELVLKARRGDTELVANGAPLESLAVAA